LSAQLTRGKWLNKTDGYIPRPVADDNSGNERTVERYKYLSFKADGTFEMDSVKTRFPGHWKW